MRKLPPLSAVRAFEAAARHQSFTRAAEELGMTQAAVSYQVKLLEERLGAALFLRRPRHVALTPTGRRLAPAVTEAFETLRAAFDGLDEGGSPVLSVTALHAVAANWLVPRLGAFQLAHPGLAVRLDTSNDLVDFAAEEFDVGFRSGPGTWPGLEAHRLFPIRYTPLCSPLLRDRLGLREPLDLLRAQLLGANDPWWRRWFGAVGLPDVDLSRQIDINLGTQVMEGMAATAGHGVAIVMPAFFADALTTGRLVQLFDTVVEDERAYWLVYPQARRRSPKVRAFRDWVLAEAARDENRGGMGDDERS